MPGRAPSITRRGLLTGSLASLALFGCGESAGPRPTPAPGGRYTTRFEGTENPLSEGGA
jgi:hypothetical protein